MTLIYLWKEKADLHFMISFKRYIFVKERPCKPNVK